MRGSIKAELCHPRRKGPLCLDNRKFAAAGMAESGQEETLVPQQTPLLFDHLVGAAEQEGWHGETERLRSLEVDDQLELRGLLYRQVGWLFALEDAAGVDASKTERVRITASVAHQAASRRELAQMGNRGHGVADGQRGELLAPGNEDRIKLNEFVVWIAP